MRLTKRQLKQIIREEYSRLKRRGLIRESNVRPSRRRLDEMHGDPMGEYDNLSGAEQTLVDEEARHLIQTQGMDAMEAFRQAMNDFLDGYLR